jgi:hypothetical protein
MHDEYFEGHLGMLFICKSCLFKVRKSEDLKSFKREKSKVGLSFLLESLYESGMILFLEYAQINFILQIYRIAWNKINNGEEVKGV